VQGFSSHAASLCGVGATWPDPMIVQRAAAQLPRRHLCKHRLHHALVLQPRLAVLELHAVFEESS
jgi:hypothetical protein